MRPAIADYLADQVSIDVMADERRAQQIGPARAACVAAVAKATRLLKFSFTRGYPRGLLPPARNVVRILCENGGCKKKQKACAHDRRNQDATWV
jgi:hypothetical protein